MAIEVAELVESRERTGGDNPTVTRVYGITGTPDDTAAKTAMMAFAPATHDGLIKVDGDVDPVFVDTVNGIGRWEGRVPYKTPENIRPAVGDSSYTFETSGGTQHITQSRSTVASYGNAPDFKGAIGVTRDGVEGVDIATPQYKWSERHILPAATVDAAYKAALFWLTGKVSDGPFKGFAPGEVLFLGSSGSKRGDDDWEVSFSFVASPNMTGIIVGDIVDIAKDGWHYMWVLYEDTEDDAAKALVKTPLAVYIEEVYEEGDLTALGI